MSGFRGLRKRRRVQILAVAAVSLAISTGLIGFAMRDGINYYRSPSQIAEAPPDPREVFRIGGLVVDGSIERGQGEQVRFVVTDGAAHVPVTFTGILPSLFAECQSMVGQGRYVGGTFEAIEILAKHDETYMPREVVGAMREDADCRAPNAEVAVN